MAREKLVRDRIPDMIRADGRSPSVRIVEGPEFDLFLRAKLVEEAEELLSSGTMTEVVDIVEVLDSFLRLRSIDWRTIKRMRSEKKRMRGGFERGYVLSLEEKE